MKKNIAIIFGGKSAEHEVSLRSAKNVADALDKDKFELTLVGISKQGSWYRFADMTVFSEVTALIDGKIPAHAEPVALISHQGKPSIFSLKNQSQTAVHAAFPVMHGTLGEDGCIQGLFKMMNIPFVGCGVLGSAAGMDKEIMKRLLTYADIKNAKYVLLTPQEKHSYDYLVKTLGTPFFIKPANAGSSVGVHKIKSEADYTEKIKDSFLYDNKVLAEEFVQGREIECSVMGHNHSPKASLPGEIIPQHDFYSYEAKYLDDNGALLKIPAELTPELQKNIQEMAIKTYKTMECDGLTRVDFFVKANNEIYVNEINTIPGFTKISMYPKMWEATGLQYRELITQLLQFAFEKFEADNKLMTSYLDLNN